MIARAAPPPAAGATCAAGTTLVVVAHEDDDLLFLSPDLVGDVKSDRCVHVVFLTAGDAGSTATYWAGRELGARAAYAKMLAVADIWTQADLVLADRQLATFTLDAAPRISLTFVRLPDGGIAGGGFAATTFKSLQYLLDGTISSLQPVDGSAAYTTAELTDTVAAIMNADQPDIIRIQDPIGAYGDGDHSDHHAAARIAVTARESYSTPHTLIAYRDYAIAGLPANVTGSDKSAKTDAFLAYAAHDALTCQSESACSPLAEGTWLSRQYRVSIWTPTSVQRAPSASATGPTSAFVGGGVTLDGSGSSDPDGGPITYSWQQLTGPAVTLAGADTVSPSFTAPSTVGVLTFGLVVSDGELLSVRNTVTVSIVANGTNVALSAVASASSQNVSTAQTAGKVADGSADGYPGDYSREWASLGEGVGAWVQLSWTSAQSLTRVVLHDRPNVVEHITSATLTFSDGTSVQTGALSNDGAGTTVSFPAVSTTSVRVTITGVDDGGLNVGLSEIEAYTDGVVTPPPPVATNVALSAVASASSQNVSTAQTAGKVADGSADGYPGDYSREWASLGEGVGAWVQLSWTSAQSLTRVVLHDRPNVVEHITSATLTFSDGTSVQTGALSNDGAGTTVSFPAVSTTSVRVTITGVDDGGLNVGLSEIEAYTDGVVTPPPPVATNVALSAVASASSQNVSTAQTAGKVADGSADGYPGDYSREWASLGEGVGAWVQLSWTSAQSLTRVVLHDRPNVVEHITSATLTFSDGTSVQTGALSNDGAGTTVSFPAVSTTSVRVTITGVDDGGLNVGLSEIEAYTS